MRSKEQKTLSVKPKAQYDIAPITDADGKMPTPEQLAKALCIAADKKAGIVRRKGGRSEGGCRNKSGLV